jgi:hypothetical protein
MALPSPTGVDLILICVTTDGLAARMEAATTTPSGTFVSTWDRSLLTAVVGSIDLEGAAGRTESATSMGRDTSVLVVLILDKVIMANSSRFEAPGIFSSSVVLSARKKRSLDKTHKNPSFSTIAPPQYVKAFARPSQTVIKNQYSIASY